MNKIWEGRGVPWVHQAILVAFLDALFVVISYGAALILRFDFSFSSIPEAYRSGYLWSMPFWIASTIVVFYAFRLYHSIWRLASISELQMSIAAYIVLLPVYGLGIMFMQLRMPKAYYFMGFIISFCMTTALRFSYRMFQTYFGNREGTEEEEQNRIMVIGGGAAGQTLIRELVNSRRLHTKVCCVIDDNPNKIGRVLEGIPIVGNRDDILTMVDRYKINHIIYAIPATTGKNQKEILNICKETKCRLQTVPGVYQLVNGEVSVSKLRDVDIADLLGRAQVRVNNDEIFRAIRGRKVLVTGGGGSIGSELCRQIAKAKPKQLIIFDIYENNAYEIQQELRRTYPQLDLEVLIGSVRNSNRINQVMHTYKPDIVYHAAAHKHVPLMEDSPNEAVNPTNIMGASKRLCEMVVQMMNRKTDTDFVAVRFGNVLGSNGSVIPLFKKQIAEGGPVTVTDKDIIRYFMTIPEAVALVLQASYYAEGGEIFVLDMGDPVRIDDMARNLIRLSGYEPDIDIPIVYTGLRPGEKLYEELLMDEEGLQDTANEMIHIGHPIEMDDEWFEEKLKLLDKVSRQDSARIKEIVAEIVPTYHFKK